MGIFSPGHEKSLVVADRFQLFYPVPGVLEMPAVKGFDLGFNEVS